MTLAELELDLEVFSGPFDLLLTLVLREEVDLLELEPGEAAEELLARMLEAHRYRAAAAHLAERLTGQPPLRHRVAALPAPPRPASLDGHEGIWDPRKLGSALGGLLAQPAQVDLR